MKRQIEDLPQKNTPKNYVAIRVTAVHVKKRWLFGFCEKVLGFRIAIPDSPQKADELMGRIDKLMKEYGIGIDVEVNRL